MKKEKILYFLVGSLVMFAIGASIIISGYYQEHLQRSYNNGLKAGQQKVINQAFSQERTFTVENDKGAFAVRVKKLSSSSTKK